MSSDKASNKVIVKMDSLLAKLQDAGVSISYEDSKRLGINGVLDIIKNTLKS
jgi:hypothetical protein